MMVRAWGTAPAEGFACYLAIEDPAEFMAAAFKEALRGRGIIGIGQRPVSRHKYQQWKRRLCRRAGAAAQADALRPGDA
jgi:hypothetical protein